MKISFKDAGFVKIRYSSNEYDFFLVLQKNTMFFLVREDFELNGY